MADTVLVILWLVGAVVFSVPLFGKSRMTVLPWTSNGQHTAPQSGLPSGQQAGPLFILALGDSKAAPDSNEWGHLLAADLSTETMQSWHAIELGRGGYTVEKTLANVFINNDRATFSAAIIPAAEFACEKSGSKLDRCAVALHGLSPSYIFINLGVNDVGYIPPWSLPDEAVWKSNYLALVDACHAQWPAAQIYLSKPWKAQSGGNDISFDTLATWIDAIVAQRSSFVQVGDDERLWFKPKASGLSVDGIHPNKAGQLAAKNAKRALLRSHGAAPRNDDQKRTTLPNLKRVKERRQPR